MHPHVSVLSADGAVLVSIPVSWILSLFGRDLMKINISILWFLEPYGSPLGRCGGGGALQDRQNAASLVCHSPTMCLLRISTEILDCGSPLAARRTSWDIYFGLKGRLPHFIDNFLSNRNFKVRVGTTLSDLQGQEEGVPQGSILSVTLFSIKINNIVKSFNPGVDCSLYVDDFLICYRCKHMHTIERQLQQCLNKIQKWALENGFKFSKTKTQCMHFCQLRGLHNDPVLKLDGVEIPVVDQYKMLGVIFDRKLSFIPHINYLKSKCHKALQLLRVVAHTDWGGGLINLLYLNYIDRWFDQN